MIWAEFLGVAALLIGCAAPLRAQASCFDDLTARQVCLDRPAERVVTIPMPSASTFIAVDGAAQRLVGMHPASKRAIDEGLLGRIFPQARAIDASIAGAGSDGFMPNVETLARLDPDIVVQWGDRGDDIVGPLRNAGLTAALLRYGTEPFARGNLTLMGDIAGKPERAKALIAWRDATIADIEKAARDIRDGRRLKVVFLQRAASGLAAAGANSYNDFCIRLVGGVNAAAELVGAGAVNAEQIAQWDPDVILLNSFEEQLAPARIYDDAILSATRAARERRVYKMPIGGYRWDPPSQESPLTWMWLADILYPGAFHFDLRAEIARAYRLLYGFSPSDSDMDEILRIRTNGDARHYERFATSATR
ncbi:ABC transporter substrate-binding protein [Methylosinus sporium]|uniref:ABC transporter substrate-binding protein n=1 Tax=Methylosinus sporium TaxID=428 RepID=A0A549SMS9_METSR|nr:MULTISPECIES: ABC transporter substrate-binding protein [Methylosinus]MBU3890322.1 ABC transporter substrate-binding protein [Methylosinus sp. KRF6]TRL30936.1 ABC transporter substrate-binding protein [Methylosinus sporium]